VPTWTPRTPGVHAARLEVAGPRLATSFHLPDLVVHADHASAHAAGMQDEEPVDAVPFLLEAQWEVGLRTELVERHVLSERLAVVGTFGAPSGSLAVAGSSVSGRIEAPLSGPLPGLGQTVEAGQVLARVAQALDHADHAAPRANELAEQALALSAETFRSELQLRDLDLGLRALEAEQALVEARTERAFAERALERARDLRAKELETAAGLEQAELAVRRAVQAEAAALALGERTDALRSDLASLVSLARNPAEEAHGPDKDLHDVVAPIAGELIEVRAVLGEEVDQGAGLFRVLDPRRLWLTLQVSEFDLHRLGANPGPAEPPRLHLELPGRPGERLDVLTELGGHLVQVGRTVDPVSRTVALTYELDNPDGAFRLGALADGSLETVHRRDAVAVPEQAVVLDGGREVVFVVLDGETFVRREVQLGIRDGGLVEVLSGVEPGDRVVVDGAYLVKLAAASPDTFGDGHAH